MVKKSQQVRNTYVHLRDSGEFDLKKFEKEVDDLENVFIIDLSTKLLKQDYVDFAHFCNLNRQMCWFELDMMHYYFVGTEATVNAQLTEAYERVKMAQEQVKEMTEEDNSVDVGPSTPPA